MEKIKGWMKQNKLWIAVWGIGTIVFILISWNRYIAYDESYTLCLIEHPVKELIRITGMDVHPPLYYLVVKLFAAPFGYSIAVIKAVNLLPFFGMLLLGRTYISKLWGERTGLWAAALTILLPASQTYLLPEMRMYGFASFWVVLCLIMEQILRKERKDVLAEKKAWIIFAASGIGAAYTHYYALIAVAFIYLCLGVSVIWKNKRQRLGWILSAAASAVLYLPWLLVLLRQFGEVKNDYWIPELTIRTCISYIIMPVYSSLPAVWGGILLFFCGILLITGTRRKPVILKNSLILTGTVSYIGMIATGILVSVCVRPVFSVRYVKCVLGVLILMLAFVIGRLSENMQKTFLYIFVLFSVINIGTMAAKNYTNGKSYDSMMGYICEHFQEDSVLLTLEDNHYMGMFSYFLKDKKIVIPDQYDKDEYEAFSPTLYTRSELNEKIGQLEKQDLWVIDEGNMKHNKPEWDQEQWEVIEASPEYVFRDATNETICYLTHIRPKERE